MNFQNLTIPSEFLIRKINGEYTPTEILVIGCILEIRKNLYLSPGQEITISYDDIQTISAIANCDPWTIPQIIARLEWTEDVKSGSRKVTKITDQDSFDIILTPLF